MTIKKTLQAGFLACVALVLAACGTTGGVDNASGVPTVGDGRYGVFHFEGLPARNGWDAIEAAEWTPTEFMDLQDLDRQCHAQMDPQLPSAISEVSRMALTIGVPTAVGSGVGGGLGAISTYTGVSFTDYFKHAGLSGLGSAVGSGIGAGVDRVHLTRNYVQYACMQFAVGEARRHGRLRGIGIIPFPGVGSMRPVSMPNVAPSRGDNDNQADATNDNEEADDNDAFVPMPM